MPTDTIPVTLYAKPGCHLCEDAALLLEVLGREYPLRVAEVDITSAPDLYDRYKWEIPVVVTPHGQTSGRIGAADLRRLFAQAG